MLLHAVCTLLCLRLGLVVQREVPHGRRYESALPCLASTNFVGEVREVWSFVDLVRAQGREVTFVERDSYAIALPAAQAAAGVTRWGLFLMRGVRFSIGSIAYGKAGSPRRWNSTHSQIVFIDTSRWVQRRWEPRSPLEGAGLEDFPMMITKIESSTEVVSVKSCAPLKTNNALWYLREKRVRRIRANQWFVPPFNLSRSCLLQVLFKGKVCPWVGNVKTTFTDTRD